MSAPPSSGKPTTRALWYAHTAASRAAEQRARDELGARGVDPDHLERPTTAEQWIEAHRADHAAEDQRREITDEHDLADVFEQRQANQRAVEREPAADTAETTCATSVRTPPPNPSALSSPRTTGPVYLPQTRPPTQSPEPSVPSQNSKPVEPKTSDARPKRPAHSNSPGGTTTTNSRRPRVAEHADDRHLAR
jgi:hypothetical protein